MSRLHRGSRGFESLTAHTIGEVREWFNRTVSKTVVVFDNRGFESHPLRINKKLNLMTDFLINNQIIFLFIATIVILIIWNITLSYKLWQIRKKLKTFFNGKKASDLEGVLFEEIKRLKKAEDNIKKLLEFSKELEKITKKSIQKIGVIRFNPFKETGGDQSFVVALLDYQDNGLVISSLYTREGTRIYSKPIENGQSKYPLSKEELEALKKAGIRVEK